MRRLFSTLMIGMFAFGFCVSLSGCGEEATPPPPETEDAPKLNDGGSENAASDKKE